MQSTQSSAFSDPHATHTVQTVGFTKSHGPARSRELDLMILTGPSRLQVTLQNDVHHGNDFHGFSPCAAARLPY